MSRATNKELRHSRFPRREGQKSGKSDPSSRLLVPDIGSLIQGNLTSIIARYVRICEKFTNTAIIVQPK